MAQTPAQKAGLIKARAVAAEKRRLYELSLQPETVLDEEVAARWDTTPLPPLIEEPLIEAIATAVFEENADEGLVNSVTDSNLEAERRRALRTISVNDLVTILVRLGKLERVPDNLRALNPPATFLEREALVSTIILSERERRG